MSMGVDDDIEEQKHLIHENVIIDTTTRKPVIITNPQLAHSLGLSSVRLLQGYPIGFCRLVILLYLTAFWFWSIINAGQASSDRLFVQLSNYNMMLTVGFFIIAAYYSFRFGSWYSKYGNHKPEDRPLFASKAGDVWLPYLCVVLYQTAFSISLVVMVFFFAAESGSQYVSGVDYLFALNSHCLVFFFLFFELLINKIEFYPNHLIYVVVFSIVGLINDAYASASYGITPRQFSQSEVSMAIYMASALFCAFSFGLGYGLKLLTMKLILKCYEPSASSHSSAEDKAFASGDASIAASPERKSSTPERKSNGRRNTSRGGKGGRGGRKSRRNRKSLRA